MIRAHENPFRTERVESILKFQPEWLGETWTSIIERWESFGRRASIVGPHGSGKTTFLESIAPRLTSLGYEVQFVNACAPAASMPVIQTGSIVLLDSRGQSPRDRQRPFANWSLRRSVKRRLVDCRGVIETRHHRGRRRVVLRTHTTPMMLEECIRCVYGSDLLTSSDVTDLFRKHRGNIRNALRDCYDRVSVK